MIQRVAENHSTPELVIDQATANRIEARLGRGHYGRLCEDGTMIASTDGAVFSWFKTRQIIGSILRREFALTSLGTSCAIHFRVLRAVERKEAAAVLHVGSGRRKATLKRGYWYAVHGD